MKMLMLNTNSCSCGFVRIITAVGAGATPWPLAPRVLHNAYASADPKMRVDLRAFGSALHNPSCVSSPFCFALVVCVRLLRWLSALALLWGAQRALILLSLLLPFVGVSLIFFYYYRSSLPFYSIFDLFCFVKSLTNKLQTVSWKANPHHRGNPNDANNTF